MRRIRKFHCVLGCRETYWHSVRNTYICYVGPKFIDCFIHSFNQSFIFHIILYRQNQRFGNSHKKNIHIKGGEYNISNSCLKLIYIRNTL